MIKNIFQAKKFSDQQEEFSNRYSKFSDQQKGFLDQCNKFSNQQKVSQDSYNLIQNNRAAKFNAFQKFYGSNGSNRRITKFIVPGPAKGKGRPRMVIREGFSHVYTPSSTVQYQKRVAQCYVDAGGKFLGSNCKILIWITVCVRNTKLKSFKKIKEFRPIKRPDLDNVAKIILDSLTGIAYGDDAQVVNLTVSRIFDKENEVFVSIKDSDDEEFFSNSS